MTCLPLHLFRWGTFRTLPPPPPPLPSPLADDGRPRRRRCLRVRGHDGPSGRGRQAPPLPAAPDASTNYRRPSSVTTEHQINLANQRSGDGVGGRSSVSHKQRAGSLIQCGFSLVQTGAQSDKVRQSPEPLPQSSRTAAPSTAEATSRQSHQHHCGVEVSPRCYTAVLAVACRCNLSRHRGR